MSFETEAAADLVKMIAEFGAAWTWSHDSQSYNGVQGDASLGSKLTIEGFSSDVDFSLTFIKSAFATLPAYGQTFTSPSSVVYRVVKVTTSEGDPGVTVDCQSLNAQ